MLRRASLLLILVVFAGCPDSKNGGSGDAASVDSGVPMSGKIKKKPGETKPVEPAAKKEESGFSREALIELYRAEQIGDVFAAKKKYGLLDEHGKDVPAKSAEYEAALKRFAEEHGDEFSKLVDDIEAERAKAAGAADVQKK